MTADPSRLSRRLGLVDAVPLALGMAALGVLLSLIVGVSRTAFAMATTRELPAARRSVFPSYPA